jgi:hypothetical protein
MCASSMVVGSSMKRFCHAFSGNFIIDRTVSISFLITRYWFDSKTTTDQKSSGAVSRAELR